jgi:recombinational DNA repair ATPase RecF
VFPAAGVAIIGDNGSGKTNLLEALHYLEIFRSFRGAPTSSSSGSAPTRSTCAAASRTRRRAASWR